MEGTRQAAIAQYSPAPGCGERWGERDSAEGEGEGGRDTERGRSEGSNGTTFSLAPPARSTWLLVKSHISQWRRDVNAQGKLARTTDHVLL